MSIAPLQNWKDTFANLPKVADTSWAANFAAAYAGLITGITTDPAALVPTGFLFTFAQPVFAAQLLALTPVGDALSGITGFAAAWEAALLASVALVLPASFVPPTSPATLFSAVTTTTITPVSIAAGKAKILELVTAPPVADAQDSQFPIKFREATLLLKITVVGLNSLPPPPAGPGPQPFTAANVPLI